MTIYRNSTPDRYRHIETVDGLKSGPYQRCRLGVDLPTEDDIRPALLRGVLIGLALVAPFWVFFGLAMLRWGF